MQDQNVRRIDPSTLDRRMRAAQYDRNVVQRSRAAKDRARPLTARPFASLASLAAK